MAIYSIYRITNQVNGKVYIGKTVQSPNTRFNNHKHSARTGSNTMLHASIRKHGEENFKLEVIFVTFSEGWLSEFEQLFIAEYQSCILDPYGHGYNMTRGGDGMTSESAKARNQILINENRHPFQGERGSRIQRRKLDEGSHPFQLAFGSVEQRRKLDSGVHPFQGIATQNARAKNKELVEQGKHILQGESGRTIQVKRILAGTHPLAGEAGSKLQARLHAELVANGTHNFQSEAHKERVADQIKNGTHQNNVSHTCPHCNKEGKGNAMLRYHFDKCKVKPR